MDYDKDSPIMVRNYAPRGARWLRGSVEKQTGPVSYRCRLDDGRLVKRHQDQLHTRLDVSPTPPLWRPASSSSSVLPDQDEVITLPFSDTVSEQEPPLLVSAPIDPGQAEDNIPLRRSIRSRKPVERLNL